MGASAVVVKNNSDPIRLRKNASSPTIAKLSEKEQLNDLTAELHEDIDDLKKVRNTRAAIRIVFD